MIWHPPLIRVCRYMYAGVLDFSKAFDLVPHNRIIQKLMKFKINLVIGEMD